jgi:hypothetical protein
MFGGELPQGTSHYEIAHFQIGIRINQLKAKEKTLA